MINYFLKRLLVVKYAFYVSFVVFLFSFLTIYYQDHFLKILSYVLPQQMSYEDQRDLFRQYVFIFFMISLIVQVLAYILLHHVWLKSRLLLSKGIERTQQLQEKMSSFLKKREEERHLWEQVKVWTEETQQRKEEYQDHFTHIFEMMKEAREDLQHMCDMRSLVLNQMREEDLKEKEKRTYSFLFQRIHLFLEHLVGFAERIDQYHSSLFQEELKLQLEQGHSRSFDILRNILIEKTYFSQLLHDFQNQLQGDLQVDYDQKDEHYGKVVAELTKTLESCQLLQKKWDNYCDYFLKEEERFLQAEKNATSLPLSLWSVQQEGLTYQQIWEDLHQMTDQLLSKDSDMMSPSFEEKTSTLVSPLTQNSTILTAKDRLETPGASLT
jgi:membrane-associated HD superfamily phosphohydrolase